MTTKQFKVESEPRPYHPKQLRPYLSKSVAAGLRSAAKTLDELAEGGVVQVMDQEYRRDLAKVAMWLRENAWWYFDSGRR